MPLPEARIITPNFKIPLALAILWTHYEGFRDYRPRNFKVLNDIECPKIHLGQGHSSGRLPKSQINQIISSFLCNPKHTRSHNPPPPRNPTLHISQHILAPLKSKIPNPQALKPKNPTNLPTPTTTRILGAFLHFQREVYGAFPKLGVPIWGSP